MLQHDLKREATKAKTPEKLASRTCIEKTQAIQDQKMETSPDASKDSIQKKHQAKKPILRGPRDLNSLFDEKPAPKWYFYCAIKCNTRPDKMASLMDAPSIVHPKECPVEYFKKTTHEPTTPIEPPKSEDVLQEVVYECTYQSKKMVFLYFTQSLACVLHFTGLIRHDTAFRIALRKRQPRSSHEDVNFLTINLFKLKDRLLNTT